MLPGLPTNLAPVSPAGGAAPAVGDARQVAFQRALGGLVGQSMPGKVLANLTDGSSLVSVAGNSVRMTIPGGAAVDSEVPLTLISTDPRPTFQVGARQGLPAQLVYPELADSAAARQEPSSSAPTQIGARAAEAAAADLRGALPGQTPAAGQSGASAATGQTAAQASAGEASAAQAARPASPAAVMLSKAPLTPAALLPGFDPSAPAPTLSLAARTIASVLTQAASGPASAQVLSGKVPLLQPGMNGEQLAQKLQDTVKASGLFYESHVADWAQGKHELPDLQREPQMQKALQDATQNAVGQRGQPAATAEAGTDMAAAQMINLQLHTHEQSRVAWQGEAWPGQKIEWDIRRDGAGDGPGSGASRDAGEHRAWRSGVRFQLPTLGQVSATVVLVGGQVHIQMQADSGDSAAMLRLHAGALEQSLAAAGSPLSSFSVGAAGTLAASTEADDAGAD